MKKNSPSSIVSSLLVLAVLMTILAGCEKHTRHRVLTFFFTGVPSLEEQEKMEKAEEEKGKGEGREETQTVDDSEKSTEISAMREIARTEPSSHVPFADGSCHECHLVSKGINFGMFRSKETTTRFTKGGGIPAVLSAPRTMLCFRCHGQKSEEVAEVEGLWLHTPAAQGECSACHDPHQSDYPKLLLTTRVEICRGCHSDHPIKDTMGQLVQPDEGCLDCHNPHLGIDRLMLRKDYAEKQEVVN